MLYYCFFFYHLIQICPNHEAESLSGDRVSHGIQLAWSQTGQFLVGAGDANTVRLSTVVRIGDGQIKLFDYRAPPWPPRPGSWPSRSTSRWCCYSRCRKMANFYQDTLMGTPSWGYEVSSYLSRLNSSPHVPGLGHLPGFFFLPSLTFMPTCSALQWRAVRQQSGS